MNNYLNQIKMEVYEKCSLEMAVD